MFRSFANNTKIKTKLKIVFVFPAVVLVLLSASQMMRMWENVSRLKVAQELIGASIDISQLVTELQRERGLSAGFIGGLGKIFAEQLKAQRRATDRVILTLPGFLVGLPNTPAFVKLTSVWGKVLKDLAKRPSIHGEVDASRQDSMYWHYYSGLIGDIINLIQSRSMVIGDAQHVQLLHAYTTLLWLEERLGEERGMMNTVISQGRFTLNTFGIIMGYMAQQEALISEFQLIASENAWKNLNAVLLGDEAQQIAALRKSVTDRLSKSDLLSKIQSEIGYGGFIHHFKNYILRGTEVHRTDFLKTYENLQVSILRYQGFPSMSQEEQAAVGDIKAVLQAYRTNVDVVSQLLKVHKSSQEIDAIVEIDDSTAYAAIETLRLHIVPTGAVDWFALTSRYIDKISVIRNGIKSQAIANMDDLRQKALGALALYALATVLVLGFLFVSFGLVSKRFSTGILRISDTLERVDSYGDYSEKVQLDGADEIGVMARRINNHLRALELVLGEVNTILSNAANGSFSVPKTKVLPGELGELMQGVETSTRRIEVAMAEQLQTAEILRKATNEAEQANLAKSDFLASMSHELRTPLNAILGFAQVLEMELGNPLDEGQKSAVSHIMKGGEHLLQLINEVLDLAKIESGSFSVTISDVNPSEVIADCLLMATAMAEKYQVSIENKALNLELPMVRTDPIRFKQILLNLLSNGVKYNMPGGWVRMEVMDVDGFMRFKVIDNGPGIDAEKQKNLFVPFDRLGQEALDVEGTGIGLTITQRLIKSMDGRLDYESKLGEGSSFWVDLPKADRTALGSKQTAEAEKTAQDSVPPEQDHHCILYIEDNLDNVQLMEFIIGSYPNVDLISAHTAEIGLVMAEKELPNLIFMDINLPEMNGDEAMRVLLKNDAIAHIPVVAISANARPEDIELYMESGFLDYISKPFDVEQIITTIRDVLGEDEAET